MENPKFVNYYIDTLISTMTDAVVKNVSLQATARITNEHVEEQTQRISELEKTLNELSNRNISEESSIIKSLEIQLEQSKKQVDELSEMRADFENTKHQVAHLETFKSELLKARKEITDRDSHINSLNEEIKKLEVSLGRKRKKATPPVVVKEETKPEVKEETKKVETPKVEEDKTPKQGISLIDLIVKKDKKKPEVSKVIKTDNSEIEDGGSF